MLADRATLFKPSGFLRKAGLLSCFEFTLMMPAYFVKLAVGTYC